MIKIEMEKGNISKAEITGTTAELFADVCYLVGYIYWALDKDNKECAKQFKGAFVHSFGHDAEFVDSVFDAESSDFARNTPMDEETYREHREELKKDGFDVEALDKNFAYNAKTNELKSDIDKLLDALQELADSMNDDED